ncbi:MAG TPA: carboxypeptidase-like regulatory domain-containing protein, partial [Candidatus Methanoperedens sp.]|nr:carboxypeptidase-like regulatory domain-containing protein [Candidatus Methanoperedens sp.]
PETAARAAAVSGPSGEDGSFSLTLAPGTYHLVARRQEGTGEGPVPVGGLFSYHGSNPFTLFPGSVTEVNFSLARKAAETVVTPAADPAAGTISGIVTREGRPVEGVQVRLFLDAESAFRGSGYAAAPPTDASGAFAFELLPESSYYVIARRRGAGGPGPVAEGDLYGYYVDNPVPVRAGTAVRIEFELVSKGRELGNADGRPRPSGTRITGRITDAAGAVVPGVYAFAYEEKVMAHKKPAFISQPVDAAGRYVINLSAGGTYYVGARSAYGDSPGRGEWYGRYDGTPDHGVKIEAGALLEGVDIRVERILE